MKEKEKREVYSVINAEKSIFEIVFVLAAGKRCRMKSFFFKFKIEDLTLVSVSSKPVGTKRFEFHPRRVQFVHAHEHGLANQPLLSFLFNTPLMTNRSPKPY